MSETRTYEIETSLTLDYRKERWGLERIVLDGVSNHLPADSKGNSIYVKLKQDGKYVDLKEADPNKPTEEVIFEDDGKGYDAGLLSVLFSTKGADALSVGQFGEGLKLVAAAALREKLDIEYHSKNWIATPYTKRERIANHDLDRLCFRIIENGYNLKGSRTIIKNPNEAFLKELFQIPDKVLAFDDKAKVLHESLFSMGYKDSIVERNGKENAIFIKGVKVQSEPRAIFSYDLGIEDITPDRIYAAEDTILNKIEGLLKLCTNSDVIERIIKEAHENPDSYRKEFIAFNERRKHQQGNNFYGHRNYSFIKQIDFDEDPNKCIIKIDKPLIDEPFMKNFNIGPGKKLKTPLWAETFKKMYGENAVISSHNEELNEDARLMGFTPVKINQYVRDYLNTNGIKRVDDFVKRNTDKVYKWVDEKDLTIEEKLMLERRYRINKKVFGSREEEVPIRIYSALYIGDKEIPASLGVTIIEGDKKYICLKRDLLNDRREFYKTYLHELGHYKTEAGDRNRNFVDVFVDIIADDMLSREDKNE